MAVSSSSPRYAFPGSPVCESANPAQMDDTNASILCVQPFMSAVWIASGTVAGHGLTRRCEAVRGGDSIRILPDTVVVAVILTFL
jgi:hypothetical protein